MTHGLTRCICGHYFSHHHAGGPVIGDNGDIYEWGDCTHQPCECRLFVDARKAVQTVPHDAIIDKADLTRAIGNAVHEELAAQITLDHRCHARGCRATCDPEKLMCYRHWRLVPPQIKRAVYGAYRAGQCDDMNPSEAWFIAADAAILAVAKVEGLEPL